MKNKIDLKQESLDYHRQGRPGKMEILPTKPSITSYDLSLAYTPGVGYPCKEINKNPADAYKYTAKGNLVAVISNGSSVLGFGNIGPLASKPVMEGKGMLFKRFADIDVFDLEITANTVEEVVQIISALEPTFGGINIEDIKAPECFEIEKQLSKKMRIPVFHDDQHGTAIVASAGLLNAIELSNKNIEEVKVVFSGAGAASLACAELFLQLGVQRENLIMSDSKGVIYKGRKEGMNKYKDMFAATTPHRTLKQALHNADVFIGCSRRGLLTKEMVASMASHPIIFAMANPEPEIYPDEVRQVRDDAIIATGRSDFPNQINNVLVFPFIFRGALDVRATKINNDMKLAAVKALADLAKENVPDEVKLAYNNHHFSFGPNYIIPMPFDSRVLTWVAPSVAKAAIESGVAGINIENMSAYTADLANRLSTSAGFIKHLRDRLKGRLGREKKTTMVFAEGASTRILQTVKILLREELISPILLGEPQNIRMKMEKLGLAKDLETVPILKPDSSEHFQDFCREFYQERARRGISLHYAKDMMIRKNYFGSMLVKRGSADVFIAGPTLDYPSCLMPILDVIGTQEKKKASGICILILKNRTLFLADCTAQIDPSADDLAEIAFSTSKLYQQLMKQSPRIAFLSYSNFGSSKQNSPKKVKEAVEITKKKYPHIKCDGEMQADVAVNNGILNKLFPFTTLDQKTDILIFPDLNSSNIAYKLISQLTETTAIGPILVPMKSTVNIIQRTAKVVEIVNMCVLTALLEKEQRRTS